MRRLTEEHRKKLSENHWDCAGKNNPMYGKHLSEETKRKISLANTGHRHTEEAKIKISIAGRGKKYTDASKKKMSEAKRGKKLSEETKRKLSEIRGEKHWAFGKHLSEETKKKISERLEKYYNKHNGWSKGLTKFDDDRILFRSLKSIGKKLTEEHKRKIGMSRDYPKGKDHHWYKAGRFGKNAPHFGRKHSEKTKIKMRKKRTEWHRNHPDFLKGEKNHNFGKILSEEVKKKMSEARIGKSLWGGKRSDDVKKKMSKALKGRKVSLETRMKISEIQRGRKASEDTKRRMSESQKGRIVTPETRIKIGDSHRGEKSVNWLGGKSFEPYGIAFNRKLKEQIKQRDNYECQECHTTQEQVGYKLHVHHIDFVKTHNCPSNLITLCRSCHAQTNFNRTDWTEYFRKLINN